jgi:hypothetical protein
VHREGGAVAIALPVARRRDLSRRRLSVPWRAEDLVRWMSASALSGILVIVGWYLAAGQARDTRQIGPLDLAIAGAVLGGVANVTWLLRGWHSVGERRKALVAQLSAALPVPPQEPGLDFGEGRLSAAEILVGGRSRYFHRPGCPLARGRDWTPEPLAVHLRAGREPCGVCRP